MFSSLLHAWRSWKSAKAVAVLAIAALAVGIGSTTAIYTVVHAVLLKPLPYQQGERFVSIFGGNVNEPGGWSGSSWPNLLEYKEKTRSFDLFGIYREREFSLTSPGAPQRLAAVEVSPALVNGLGVSPLAGRWFQEAANESGSLNLAVISASLAKRLGGAGAMVGRTLTLDGRPYTVTGVMPEWFHFPVATVYGGEVRSDLWVPLNPQGSNRNRDNGIYLCYARMKPGVTLAQANADVKRVAAELAKEYPAIVGPAYTANVVHLRSAIAKEIRPTLLLLFGAAGVLLLITCANVAGLLLARSVTRARETAVRVALGASQTQLASQYFAEGLLVSLAGAAGGVLISLALVRFVLSVAADYVPRADEIAVDWQALAFALAAAVLGSLLFSLAPLWQASRTLPNEVLSDGTRASAPARSRLLSRSLVIAEIALAFALLSLSALLLAHLTGLLRIRPGFDPANVVTFSLNASDAEYPAIAQLEPYQLRLLRSLKGVPGVSDAALVNQLPLDGCCFEAALAPEGGAQTGREAIAVIMATPTYLRTMRIPLLAGRFFDEALDSPASNDLSLVVSRAAARHFWPNRNAVGAYALLGAEKTRARVVGIAGGIRHKALSDDPVPVIYLPATQIPVNPAHFVVRSALPLETLAPQLRTAIQHVNRAQPIYDLTAMTDIVRDSLITERLQSFLTGFFAFAALLMAGLGVYGVVSYSVRHRTVEIGTRMALGAVNLDVLGLILRDGLKMAAWGVGIGAVAVFATVRLLQSEVFGIQIGDPRPFLYSTAIVASLAVAACLFPAWRAAMVSPMVAIRDDPGSLWQNARVRLRRIFTSDAGGENDLDEGALLAEFVDASRHAESFREAIDAALETLRRIVNCQSINLSVSEETSLLMGRLRCYPFPLPLNASDFDAWRRWDTLNTPRHGAEIEDLTQSAVRLAVPLLSKNKVSGALLLGAPIGRSRYSAAEKRALRACAAQFALMLENERLTDRMLEQEKLRRDVQLASEVQKRLFPDAAPEHAMVTLAGMSLPARGVGGDYYDFLDLGDERIGIALADVAGKGVAAALIMSVVQASLRILAVEEGITLSTLAAKMNRYLHRSTRSSGYATFFYAEIDERKRQLRYVNAGHNPPYLMRYVAIEELPAGGTVIGLFPQSSYEEAVVDLHPGDVLMAFTDGVPEALNPAEEEFGEDRLKAILRECASLRVEEISARVAEELKTWIADAPQYDDLTFILVKVKPNAP